VSTRFLRLVYYFILMINFRQLVQTKTDKGGSNGNILVTETQTDAETAR
jgi:hypothetical protein